MFWFSFPFFGGALWNCEYQNSEENEYYVGDDTPYHIREDVPNLQKKAIKRYDKIHTDFTPP